MLDKVIMLPFSIFLIFLFVFFAVTGMGMFTWWQMAQNEAQFIASSMAKYGGYTEEAEETVEKLADKLNISRSKIDVEVNSVGPIPWGMETEARVTLPYRFKVGKYDLGTVNVSGVGRSVSTFLGERSVNYIVPR